MEPTRLAPGVSGGSSAESWRRGVARGRTTPSPGSRPGRLRRPSRPHTRDRLRSRPHTRDRLRSRPHTRDRLRSRPHTLAPRVLRPLGRSATLHGPLRRSATLHLARAQRSPRRPTAAIKMVIFRRAAVFPAPRGVVAKSSRTRHEAGVPRRSPGRPHVLSWEKHRRGPFVCAVRLERSAWVRSVASARVALVFADAAGQTTARCRRCPSPRGACDPRERQERQFFWRARPQASADHA